VPPLEISVLLPVLVAGPEQVPEQQVPEQQVPEQQVREQVPEQDRLVQDRLLLRQLLQMPWQKSFREPASYPWWSLLVFVVRME
jgi:hypothetical protein